MSDTKSYFKSRIPFALVILVMIALAWILCGLYSLPAGPFIHMTYLTATLCIFAAAVDFIRYRNRLAYIRKNIDSDDILSSGDAMDRVYIDRIEDLQNKLRDLNDSSNSRYNEMVDYYTIWAHQIKTPISALSLTTQNIEDDDLRESLMTQIVRIEDYADMVMGYIRLDSDSNDLVFKKQPLDNIVGSEIKKQRSAIVAKGLSFDYAPGGFEAVTDARWLGFAVGQVLSNSIKYTSSGKIKVSTYEDKVIIEDEGMGIAPEDLPRVFEKGYTGYNGRGDKKSTGIGLYLVKRTMDMLGGDIKIESEVSRGTKVTLYLTKA